MSKRLTLKDHEEESRRFTRRSVATALVVLCFAGALFFRLAYLQIVDHKMYSTLSRHNLLYVMPIEPNRGLIYDRNGVLLAKNLPEFSLDIIPGKIKNMSKTIAALKKILPITDEDIKNFKHSLKRHRHFQEVPLMMNLSETEVAQFYVNSYRFPGVSVQSQMLRYYPLGKSMSNVVGYVGRINSNELNHIDRINYSASNYIGKVGIEKYYETQLHGTVGMKEVEINASGQIIRTIKSIPPIPGNNIHLTIDSRLQAFAEKKLGKNNGAIVAIQPATGQVLALVTKPNYDPNAFVKGLSNAAYKKLLHSTQHPLFNRAIRGQYAAASTIKPFIAIGALDNGAINPYYRIYDPGWFRLPNTKHVYHDWKYSGHGWVNITKAIMVSCDTFFYNVAVNLGVARLDHILEKFGFGQLTHIDMTEELPGLVPTPHWKRGATGHSWYTGDTIITGIGQGFLLVTPLQLAEATAIIAEHGARYRPHLLLSSQNSDGTIFNDTDVEEAPLVLDHPKIWDTVIHAMQGVVSNPIGTASGYGRHPSYTIAAKTGTAQVFGKERDEERSRMNIPKRLRNHHLFISFAPVKNPQIALAVIVEHASFADNMARKVTDFYFKELAEQKQKQEQKNDEQSTPTG